MESGDEINKGVGSIRGNVRGDQILNYCITLYLVAPTWPTVHYILDYERCVYSEKVGEMDLRTIVPY